MKKLTIDDCPEFKCDSLNKAIALAITEGLDLEFIKLLQKARAEAVNQNGKTGSFWATYCTQNALNHMK